VKEVESIYAQHCYHKLVSNNLKSGRPVYFSGKAYKPVIFRLLYEVREGDSSHQ
jgi:hypothetical protein